MNANFMPEKKTVRQFFVMTIVLACLVVAPPLFAQDYGTEGGYDQQQQQQHQYRPPAQQQVDINDEKLEKFAQAHGKIGEIRQDYSSEVRQTKDPDKAQELQNKYQSKMVDAIHTAGLDVNEYNEIVHVMERNPEIKEKINQFSSD